MKIKVLTSAKADLKDGFLFYERQQAGLGQYFLSEVQANIDSLLFYAGIHFKQEQGFHRMFVSQFPFAIYYRVEGQLIKVYAVLDCRSDPKKIQSRCNNL